MVKYRSVNNFTIGFGFDWKTTSKQDAQKVIKEECTKSGDKFSYIIPKGDNDVLYTTADDSDSLSAIPAAHIVIEKVSDGEDLLFFYKINEKHAWVCCVYQDEIVNGGDLIIDIERIPEELAKLAESLGSDDLSDFSFYADINALEAFEGQEINYEVDFDEIVSDFKNDFKVKGFGKAYSNRDSLVKIGIASVFTLGVVYYLFGDALWSSHEKPPENIVKKVDTGTLLKSLPKLRDRDGDDFIDKSITKSDDIILREARAQELAWLNKDLNLLSEAEFLGHLYKKIYSTSTYLAGWKLKKVTFDFSSPHALEMLYTKTSSGTALTLKKATEGKPFTLSPNGKSAIVYDKVETHGDNNKKVNFEDLAQDNYNVIQLMHEMDVNGIKWSITSLNDKNRAQPIEGLKDGSKRNSRQLNTDSREIIMQGRYLSDFEKIMPVFTQTDKLVVERIVLDVNNGVSWSLYGVFHNKFLD